jgi:hypothetical protein
MALALSQDDCSKIRFNQMSRMGDAHAWQVGAGVIGAGRQVGGLLILLYGPKKFLPNIEQDIGI